MPKNPQWIAKRNQLLILVFIASLSSCAVSNNFYMNDAIPLVDDAPEIYAGLGSGFSAKIDSVSESGAIHFSEKITHLPNLVLGGRQNLTNNLDLRGAIHLPYVLGGFGLRLGPQLALFNKKSKINVALGTDLGCVFAKDSIELFGSKSALDVYVKGALNADFFIPVTIQLGNESRLTLTARYSFNTLFIRYNTNQSKSYRFNPVIPSLAMGLRVKQTYFEASAFRYQQKFYPNFGLVYIFTYDTKSADKP